MRIDRLNLAAFGSFSGTRLDFDRDTSFHVVLGPNAAGKSTVLRAIIDLLFGIPERTADDFLHPVARLRIGANITTADGRTLSFMRRKGRKDTLLGPSEKPIPESTLQACLGAADRNLFVSMFGLGHERLRQGAEDLLQAGGALGESLFEAAGGTKSVRAVLDALATEAGELFRGRASTPRINAAIGRYSDARQQARKLALAGEDFRALEDRIEAINRTIEEQREQLTSLDADHRRLERVQRNLPRAAERTKCLQELEGLAGVPALPVNAREDRLDRLGHQRQLVKNIAAAEDEIARIETELAGLHVPAALLAEAAEIHQLNENLGAVRKATDDLPRRRTELAGLRDAIDQLLSQTRRGLTLDDAQSLRLPKPQVRRIRELALQHAGLRVTKQGAAQAATTARSDLEDAHDHLAKVAVPRDLSALVDALQEVRREGNLQKERGQSGATRDGLARRAEADAMRLHGWHGSVDVLATLAVPLPETVQKYAAALNTADGDLMRARDRVDQRQEELKEIEAEIGRLHASGDLPTIEQLTATRERREHGWALIRRAYIDARDETSAAAAEYHALLPLPEAYEASVEAADKLADRMRADAQRVATDQSLRQRCGEADTRLEEARTTLRTVEQNRASLDADWRALWAPLGVEPLPPTEMLSWLGSYRRIVETLETAQEEQRRHDRIGQTIDRCRNLLLAAFRSIGGASPLGDSDLSVLVTHCERSIAEATDAATHHQTLERSVSESHIRLRAAQKNYVDAQNQCDEWLRDWTAVVVPLGYDGTASPQEVEEFLNLVEEACTRHHAARDLERRIRRMEEDANAFRDEVTALAGRVAPELAELPPERALADITAGHRQADRDQVSRTEKEEHLESLRTTLTDAREQLADVEEELGRMLQRAACSDLDQIEAAEAQAARRRELMQALAGLETQLVAEGAGLTLDQVLDEVRDQDGDRIAVTISNLQTTITGLREERDAGLQQQGELRKDRETMVSQTNAAALAAQEAEDELAAIRADAEEYVRLRLAETVLRDFVERYREQHQDPILTRTSELFPILTLGTFTAVRTDYDEKDQPVLVGINSGGAALGVEAMSDGTRDQLYLALRLAAVEQYIAGAEPLPFIADDLLVHFDDDRARAALRVLAELGQKTQVLFFTHHRHLVELATEVVEPGLFSVHQIPVGN